MLLPRGVGWLSFLIHDQFPSRPLSTHVSLRDSLTVVPQFTVQSIRCTKRCEIHQQFSGWPLQVRALSWMTSDDCQRKPQQIG